VRRLGPALLATAALTVGLSACGSSGTSGSSTPSSSASPLAGQKLTIYSGQHEQTVALLVKDFEARTGVKAKVRSDDEATLAGQVLQEGSASPADVFYAENPPALTTLDDKGLLTQVNATTLSSVPKDVSDPTGKWVGVSGRAAVFVANNSVPASELPTSVFDLTKSPWRGSIGIAPSETDFSPIVSKMIAAKGTAATKQWLTDLKASGKVYDSNETLVAAVNSGEVKGGIIDHYYWYRLRDEVGAGKVHCRISYFGSGDPGALVDVSGAAVLASSHHQAGAQAFLAYLVSPAAQQIIGTSESYEYPLLPSVQSSKGLKPLAQLGPLTPVATLGNGQAALTLLQDTGLL
jgi:iron(III) transport system substrate-binding protein